MTTDRPDYIPAPVWSEYLAMGTATTPGEPAPLDHAPTRAAVARLLGLHPDVPRDRRGDPEIAKTWRTLTREIEKSRGSEYRLALDWGHLFDLFVTLPRTFDARAYLALRRARELAPRIADAARDLSALLAELRELASENGVEIPGEAISPLEWIEAAAENDTFNRDLFNRFTRPGFGSPVHGKADPRYLPNHSAMLASLADAFERSPNWSRCAYANTDQAPGLSAIVRHFEVRWTDLQGDGNPLRDPRATMKARFRIADADLARILSALFAFDFSRQAVAKARRTDNT